ncbi:hydantoinase B/oxoprolinase family protein [Nocardia sp. 348MFTsu5.1]|uniref:hydantoinase B/oxoprolinase family protein n=1 Tax=Nocardia sp. 348MFTsu5.1 TaxID=1172185 RepID=UPI00037A1485|nr:hydantoinase B/oxoprolinase family protein [Nocardia sp. 348MFTsu5.1]
MTILNDAPETKTSELVESPPIKWDGLFHSYRPASDWEENLSPNIKFLDPGPIEVDPIVYEVLRYRMWTINTAHGATLVRISGSPVLQGLDFNMCILTAQGEVVMNAPYYQHLNSGAPFTIKHILEHFGGDSGVNDGDVFLCNDPWIGVVHQMDVFIGMPVFVDGELVAWVTNAAHQADLGGTAPGGFPQNAPDVFSDPTSFPPMKIVDGGKLRKDVERAYLRQSRAPGMVAMDLRGQIAGVQFARGELLRACDQFGAATVRATMGQVLDGAQREFAETLRQIPDGTWSQIRYLDEKMPGDRETHKMQVNIHKVGDRLRIDNHGTEVQSEGPNGFTFACFKGAILGGITLSMLYEQLFAAGGADRQIDWDVEPGLLNCVDWPAAVSAGSPQQLITVDLAFEAMSKMLACVPGKEADVMAQNGAPNVLVFFGAEGVESPFLPSSDAMSTGAGAHLDSDGVDTTGYVYSPLSRYPSTEDTELQYPILYVYREQQVDSGGAGEFRGGVGTRFAMVPYRSKTLGIMTAGAAQSATTHAAPGLFGGYPAPTSLVEVLAETDLHELYGDGRIPVKADDFGRTSEITLRSKTEAMSLGENDAVIVRIPGGGGVGDPLSRDPQRVADDVADGAVSVGAALDIYGVVFDETGLLDESATNAHRAELVAERKSWKPVASWWAEAATLEPAAATGGPAFRIHPRIESVDDASARVLKCTCGHVLAPGTANYKFGLLYDENPVTKLPLVMDPSPMLDEPMVFRRFCCPGCLSLMVTEVAREADGPLPEVNLA